jgi:hypothetical protein
MKEKRERRVLCGREMTKSSGGFFLPRMVLEIPFFFWFLSLSPAAWNQIPEECHAQREHTSERQDGKDAALLGSIGVLTIRVRVLSGSSQKGIREKQKKKKKHVLVVDFTTSSCRR